MILQVLLTVIGTKRFFRVLLNLTGTFVDQNVTHPGNAYPTTVLEE